MDEDAEHEMESGRRDRLLARLDHMVESGRLTDDEALRLRAAAEPGEFHHAVRDIRVRHAAMKLDAAVADRSLSRVDADGLLDRLRRGEHGRPLRAHLRRLRPGGRSPRVGPAPAGIGTPPQ
jgi:hypothetical protein